MLNGEGWTDWGRIEKEGKTEKDEAVLCASANERVWNPRRIKPGDRTSPLRQRAPLPPRREGSHSGRSGAKTPCQAPQARAYAALCRLPRNSGPMRPRFVCVHTSGQRKKGAPADICGQTRRREARLRLGPVYVNPTLSLELGKSKNLEACLCSISKPYARLPLSHRLETLRPPSHSAL